MDKIKHGDTEDSENAKDISLKTNDLPFVFFSVLRASVLKKTACKISDYTRGGLSLETGFNQKKCLFRWFCSSAHSSSATPAPCADT